MELDSMQPCASAVKRCECGCSYCDATISRSYSGTWLRSVKRKLDDHEGGGNKLFIPGLLIPDVARVEIENECVVLREMVGNQQQTIRELSVELEEERNASSSAANEAMSMILRLQREKAEIQMEARQFKRFSEEKMTHDQQEITALEDLLYKRDQTIQSLTCEVRAYKYRMMSYGLTESEADTNIEGQFEFAAYDYPSLKCHSNDPECDNETIDIDKYAFGETPRSLKDIEQRINQHSQSVLEKVIVGHLPKLQKPSSRFSTDSATIKEDLVSDSPRLSDNMRKMECYDYSSFKRVDNASEFGDDMSDRAYTVDSIHYGPKANMGTYDDCISTTNESLCRTDIEDPEVMKLYARLHALEADRESMRQALVSMRTDKAQLVLLKEIAQHLCKEMSPVTVSMMPVKKPSVFGSFFFFSVFKWILSLVFWRRRTRRSKYLFGMTAKNAGLLLVLGNGAQVGQWRCLTRTQL